MQRRPPCIQCNDEVDNQGNVVDYEIFESVINVDERMTYTDVYKILEEDDEELKKRYKNHLNDFYNMKNLPLFLKPEEGTEDQ